MEIDVLRGKYVVLALILVTSFLGECAGDERAGSHILSWDEELEISSDVLNEDQVLPRIAVEDGKVYTVWQDFEDGDWDIYYRHFDGVSWHPEQEISSDVTNEDQSFPFIAVENGRVHVVWAGRDPIDGDWDIYYRYFDGVSWQPEKEISVDQGTERQGNPQVKVEEGKIHVIWFGLREIEYRFSDGLSWSTVEIISDEGLGFYDTGWHSMDAEGQRVYVVWERYLPGTLDDILFREFDGSSWGEIVELSTDIVDEEQCHPWVAVDSGRIHVIWVDQKDGDWDIHYRHFDGSNWLPEMELSGDLTDERQTFPKIDAHRGFAHAVWTDYVQTDADIYHRFFNQTFWESEEEISTDNASEGQGRAFIAVENDDAHVVWADEGDGDSDIYYRKFSLFPPPRIISVDPGIGESNVDLDSNITVEFDKEMYTLSVEEAFTYTDGVNVWDKDDGVFHWSNGNMTAVFDPFSPYEVNSNIAVMIRATAKDTWMNTLDGNENGRENHSPTDDYIWNFSTKTVPLPGPPTKLSAVLSGTESSDVHLSWILSSDDGGGMNDVVRYDVYRSMVFDKNRGYQLHDSVPHGASDWIDVGAGEGDPGNYFYYVCAVGESNVSSCSDSQVGKFTRPLSPGPNLVSIPLIQSDESIETVLQTVSYDKAWAYHSNSTDPWKWYMPFKPYKGDLRSANHTTGIWINATRDSNLTVAGVVPAQTTIHLYEGWNLVSFPSFNASYSVADLKAEIGATRVEGYDLAPPYFLRVLGDAEVLLAGYAYWVKVGADVDWTVIVS